MITEKDIRELLEFREDGVLSLYLDTDLTRQPKEKCKLVLRDLLEEVRERVSEEDVERVKKFFDFEYDWQGKGIAIFSCQRKGFWRAYPLSVPLTSGAFVAKRPHIKPLADLLDEYERYCVVLVDREGARLFLIYLGEIREEGGTSGELPRRHKRGGWAQARYQRHIDEFAQQNLKRAAELTAHFFRNGRCGRLILGGTDETLAQFKSLLPKHLREKVVGSFPADVAASEREVLNRSMEIIRDVERRGERELVERVITLASKGGPASLGLADTLGAIYEGRVHVLVVAEGYSAKGYRCEGCGYLSAQEIGRCPFCGGDFVEIEDAVNLAVRRVVEGGGRVEIIRESDALKKAGNIGAILRY